MPANPVAPGYFISGTGTGVGKTFVAAAFARALHARGLGVGVYKPVLSGCRTDQSLEERASSSENGDDDVVLWRAAGRPGSLERVAPQRFQAPLAPHLAAQAEGKRVDSALLREGLNFWRSNFACVLVEGAGGLFSPLADSQLNIDLARDLALPVVVVAANSLGVLHATIATKLAAERAGGITLAAIVLNDLPSAQTDISRDSNFAELVRWCAPCPVLRLQNGEFPLDEFLIATFP